MGPIPLTAVDLSFAASLVLALAVLTVRLKIGVGGQILVAALRTTVQLLLIGWVLKFLFAQVHIGWMLLVAAVMLLVAGREVVVRQRRRYVGWWGFGMGTLSMFISSFALTAVALVAVIGAEPWYSPQYAIPLLGMLLGNTMTGIAVSLDRLTQTAWDQRTMIEARLMLGEDGQSAIGDIARDCMRSGMIPMINAMAAAGIVSLPGMMTGQILAGTLPLEAVKYQILIMFLVSAGTGFGTISAVRLAARRIFDPRQRLRLDRLQSPPTRKRGGAVRQG